MTSDTQTSPQSSSVRRRHSRERSIDSRDSRRSGGSGRKRREDDRNRDRESEDRHRRSSHRRSRSRSGSPSRRHSSGHRSSRRDRDRDRDYRRDDEHRRSNRHSRGGRSSRRYSRSPSPEIDDSDRDRRTVFVQQLSARLRTKELIRFFEKVGDVRDASIVKDKISGRSKGVAYVEFRDQESVLKAIDMTGERLLGIPVIVQHTEAEKNRLAMETAHATAAANGITLPSGGVGRGGGRGDANIQGGPIEARIYAGNIHFGVAENELQQIFESFGEIEFVNLQREPTGKSKGYAFIQYVLGVYIFLFFPTNFFHRYKDKSAAEQALQSMNGFMLAGRPIRVGLGADRSAVSGPVVISTPAQAFQGSAFDSTGPSIDRVGTSDSKARGNAASLDDTDVAGISYNKVSRENLMRKLMREEDQLAPASGTSSGTRGSNGDLVHHESASRKSSRCIVVQNMFDPQE